jgi:hypothetical protein
MEDSVRKDLKEMAFEDAVGFIKLSPGSSGTLL